MRRGLTKIPLMPGYSIFSSIKTVAQATLDIIEVAKIID